MKSIFKKIVSYILRAESKLVLLRYKPKIVAVTGSVGKSSTKDAVYAVLSKIAYVRKSEKSFNSEIGLPLTILGCPNGWNNPLAWFSNIWQGFWLFVFPHKYPKWLVLEVGISKPGDMKATALWLKTDVVIITAIGDTPPHIEFFDSHKHLVEEKSQLVKTLKPDGLLVLNADDKSVLEMKNKTKCRFITFGFSEGADIVGSGYSISYDESSGGEPRGLIFRVDEGGNSLPVSIDGVIGRNHAYSALATLAMTSGLKLNMIEAVGALKNYDVLPGRMRLLSGTNESMILDDTYNSSPPACAFALKTLREIKSREPEGRRIAVLGDMLELGRFTTEAHRDVGKIVKENADILVAVGPRAKGIKEGATENGLSSENIFEFLDSREAGEFMKEFVGKNDIVLVKGSQGMRMERVVEAILLDKANKEKLLVRQDEEWQKKK